MILVEKLLKVLLLSALAASAGCVLSDPPPPSILHSDTYSTLTSSEQRTLPSIEDQVFTLEDAISVGVANSPTYETTKLNLKTAYDTFYKAVFGYLPNVGLGMTGGLTSGQSRSSDDRRWAPKDWSRAAGVGGSVNMLLFDGFRREMGLLADYANVQRREHDVQFARLTLVNQLIDNYYELVALKASIAVEEENLAYQRKMLSDEKFKFKNNVVTYDKVLNFEFKVKQIEINILKKKLSYKTNGYTLAALMGLTTAELPDNIQLESLNDLVEKLKREYVLLGVEYYLDLAIDQRPDLKETRSELQQKKYQLYSAWGAFAPKISANASYAIAADDWSRYGGETMSYGITASWSLLSAGFSRIFNVRKAQINIDISKQNILKVWIDVVKEVRIAYNDFTTYIIEEKLAARAIEITRRQRDIVTEKFENQLVSVTRLNEVQSDLIGMQLSYLQAVVSVFRSKKNLESACGLVLY